MSEVQMNRSSETVRVVMQAPADPSRWLPAEGTEIRRLAERLDLDGESKRQVIAEAASVLSKCVPPSEVRGRETGLVIGYVQSGKTLSYTAVAALARDNGYQAVIIITGISTLLLDQATERLHKDLAISVRRQWQPFKNPSMHGPDHRVIRGVLADWRDPALEREDQPTLLITVMKHHGHIANLVQVLSRLDLTGVPVLIIDDEADQASLNTEVRRNGRSAIYRRLVELRAAVPHHTYLQYTATPQAPLLINIIDTLSPNFVEILSPGPDYTGGSAFFVEHPEHVRVIPDADIPSRARPVHDPPQSLLDAMMLYFLGVAAGLVEEGRQGNRSMMVHPSKETAQHRRYAQWTEAIRQNWERILARSTDPDREELVQAFRVAYQDLATTEPNLPSFEQLLHRLPYAVRKTVILEVNAATGSTPTPAWGHLYSHVLVGGQAMDRGFTVEGLTVTYMPRAVGVGNADTVQQRARFFGYKRPYIGLCRIFLSSGVRRAYERYVEHERHIHQQLKAHRDSGRPLSEWKRAFFLDPALRPTRHNVLGLDYIRGDYANDWFEMTAPHESAEAVCANREVVRVFLDALQFSEEYRGRSAAQTHPRATTTLRHAYEMLLTRLRMADPRDGQELIGILLQLSAHLERQPDANCTVFRMSGGEPRRRTLDAHGRVRELLQGADPRYKTDKSVYPGDRQIRAREGLTVQVHRLRVVSDDSQQPIDDVPAIAIWVPTEMSQAWISQPQGGATHAGA